STTPFLPPVPPPWTEHKAPGGQPYWFNPITNVSTYTRPLPSLPPPPPPPGFPLLSSSSSSSTTGIPPTPFAPPLHFTPTTTSSTTTTEQKKEKKGKKEKPKEKLLIPSTDWIRVVTNKGNVFYNNSKTK
ncbi:hypothetical protein JCM5350_004253, partial [Sporobolomyces pararoseus]